MKFASVTVLALALLPSGIVAACASGNDSELFDGGGGSTGASSSATGSNKASSSSGGPQDAGVNCMSVMCSTDLDCQNACPPAGANSNCCDTSTNTCFVSMTPNCPAPKDDGGSDAGMPPY